MLDQRTADFVKKLISNYYKQSDDFIPERTERREFGFGDFETKISFRHIAFKSGAEFKDYVVKNSPPFISSSTSEYERPDGRPMEAKGWIGSPLIFDLDASDLDLACQKLHGKGWVCDNCLSEVKSEATRLIEDFLIPDFGFLEKEISVNFSGNRGYHIRVNSSGVFKLDSRARKQISDYITGAGIDAERLFMLKPVSSDKDDGKRLEVLHGPMPTYGGWGGKVAREMITALNTGVGTLEELGISKPRAKLLFKTRADVILGISRGNWDTVPIPKKTEFWAEVVKKMAIKQSDSIDRNVTNDTGHMIRLPNTIHGDTGLIGKKLGSVKALQSFDPMKDAIVFRGKEVTVQTGNVPKFSMDGIEFGPYKNSKETLPRFAAVYLLLKRVARPV